MWFSQGGEAEPWRVEASTVGKAPPIRGGLWDVISLASDNTVRSIECKKAGEDSLKDNQRAFLEAGLERMDVRRLAIVSWREPRGV
jgi:hypothetical protein